MLMEKKKWKSKDDDPLKIKKEGDVTLQALNKELDIERMLEKEEIQREKEQADELDMKIEAEKKKNDCILKAIKEKEIENQFNLREKGRAEEITSIREVAKRQILIRRDHLRKKLDKLRKRAEKMADIKRQQIMTIRLEVADKLATAYRKGNAVTCVKATQNDFEWNSFCTGYFVNNFTDLNTCKTEKDRCHYCCETEFGNLYAEERDECVSKTCVKDAKNDEGRWVWKRQATDADNKAGGKPIV
jgi:hypothetical protein